MNMMISYQELVRTFLNTISNFTVDFSDVPLSLIQNAFRFQLKSQFNSLSNLIVTGMLKGKGIIRYESGANNNTTQMTNCKKIDGDYDLIIAEYVGKSEGTEGNYTKLVCSNSVTKNQLTGKYNITIRGDAVDQNKAWYELDNIYIAP